MVGSMAAVPLTDAATPDPGGDLSPLMGVLDESGFEVIVAHWPAWPRQLLRVSAHLYNDIEEYEALGQALVELL
jgi:isopenicillin-N epimerase